jgi:ubiquinone/menaquinone biosynthesis C-methylase UbiE
MIKERVYDAFAAGLDRKGFGQRRERQVAELRGDVLEVGAGTGLNLLRYRRADRLVALEPHGTYTGRLRARAGSAHVPVEVVEGRAEALPFPDRSFDNVVTTLALCSVCDLDGALAEIWRVLRPGGALHFLEHVRGEGGTARWQDRLTPIQRRIADGCHLNRDTATAIESAGFEFAELERFEMPAGARVIRPAIQGTALRPRASGELGR